MLLLLLLAVGSNVGLDTLALFVTLGTALDPTVTVRVMADIVTPLATGPAFVHVTTLPAALHDHPVPVPDT